MTCPKVKFLVLLRVTPSHNNEKVQDAPLWDCKTFGCFWWAYSSLALTQTLQCAFMCIDVKPRRYYAAMIWYWYKYLQLTIHVQEYLASGGWTQSFTNAIQRGSPHQPSLVAASWSGFLYLHRCMYTILGLHAIWNPTSKKSINNMPNVFDLSIFLFISDNMLQ